MSDEPIRFPIPHQREVTLRRRRQREVLKRYGLDPAHLYVECEPCRLAGRGNRIAIDPWNEGECVYGHPLADTGTETR